MHTVIAAFDDRQDAQRAFERLIESGFSRDMVHLQAQADGLRERTVGSSATDTDDDSRGFFESIRHFFAELFGSDEPAGESGRYAEAVRRGGTVVIVDAADEPEADKARETLDAMGGTIDIDERATHWSREGWTGFDANARYTGAGAATGTETARTASGTGQPVRRDLPTVEPPCRLPGHGPGRHPVDRDAGWAKVLHGRADDRAANQDRARQRPPRHWPRLRHRTCAQIALRRRL